MTVEEMTISILVPSMEHLVHIHFLVRDRFLASYQRGFAILAFHRATLGTLSHVVKERSSG